MDEFSYVERVVIDKFELQSAIEFRNDFNGSDSLDYHNNKHMNFVLQDCIEWYMCTMLDSRYAAVMSGAESLFLAAIFHDVDHTGGFRADDANVANALVQLVRFGARGSVSEHRIKGVTSDVLRFTQYPYLKDSEIFGSREQSMDMAIAKRLGAVIRDADLMTAYHGTDGIEMLAYKLWFESKKCHATPYHIYCEKQIRFLHSIEWHTDWARRKAEVLDFSGRINDVVDAMLDAGYRVPD